jgi:HSP20 family protein
VDTWKDPFRDVLDVFFETPSFIDKSNYLNRKTNVTANDENYRIQVAVPGLSKDEIKIYVTNSIINIEHKKEQTDENSFFFTNSFHKQYTMPDDCDDKKITSKMENGILEIIIPRTKKKNTERIIEID